MSGIEIYLGKTCAIFACLGCLLAAESFAQPSFSVEVAAGVAPVAQSGQLAQHFRANRVHLATIAPDDSVVFATINPLRIWRLKEGAVHLVAGGGAYELDYGFPATEVDLGSNLVDLVADEDTVTFVRGGGTLITVGPKGVIEFGGLPFAWCIARGPNGAMYATQFYQEKGLFRRPAGGDWALVPNTEDIGTCDGMTVDAEGNAILAAPAERFHPATLVRIAPNGERSAVVGKIGTHLGDVKQIYEGDGGPASEAGALFPRSPVADAAGNLYFSDQERLVSPEEGVLRRITPDGTIDRLAGCRNCLPAAVDSNGTLWVTVDEGIGRKEPGNLYRYEPDGRMIPALGPSAEDGTATGTRLVPEGIAFDAGGNLWVASRDRLVKIDATGTSTVIPGRAADATGTNGLPAPSSDFWALTVAVETSGDILVAGVLPPTKDYSSQATQAAIWRYSPEDDTFETVYVISPAPTVGVTNGVPTPPKDIYIVDIAAPANGSIYFITAVGNPYSGARWLYALRPDQTVTSLDMFAEPLFVDPGGSLWVGESRLDENDQVVGTRAKMRDPLLDQAIFGEQVLVVFEWYGFPQTREQAGLGMPSNLPRANGTVGTVLLAINQANFIDYWGGFGGEGGSLKDAVLGPSAIAVSPSGTFYLADRANQVIWKLIPEEPGQALFSQAGIVNAASFQTGALAAGSWETVYGEFPYTPTSASPSVTILDSKGVEHHAAISAATLQQFNFLVPSSTAPGEATLTISRGDAGLSWSQPVVIAEVVPGLFTLPSPTPEWVPPSQPVSGFGIAAGFAIRDLGGGQQETIPLFRPTEDPANPGTFAIRAVSLGDAKALYLSIYGTGFANSSGIENVSAEINGVSVPVIYAGPQLEYAGLDLVNIGPLPGSILDSGTTEFLHINVEGASSNSVNFDVLR